MPGIPRETPTPPLQTRNGKEPAVRYLFAILLPPIAVLSCGKPVQALLNIVLTLCVWAPGAVHAILVVNQYHEERNTDRLIRAMRGG